MKKIDLSGKNISELKEMIVGLRKEQFNIRFQISAGNVENVSKIRFIKKDIARIKTKINSNSVN
jgi:large subunit ribosomal protein L29